MHGLSIQVEKLSNEQIVNTFINKSFNNTPVPHNQWQDEWQVDVSTRANYIFFTVPPSDKPEFPLAINALPRSNSGKHKQPKVIGGCQIISSKKYYRGHSNSTTVSINLHKIISQNAASTLIGYLYHCQVKPTKSRNAATVAHNNVQKNVAASPSNFVHPIIPSISGVNPNNLAYIPEQRVLVEFSGANLNCQSGYLYPRKTLSTNCVQGIITLSPFTQSPFIEMVTRFHIPSILEDNFYFPVLQVCDLFYSFPDCLIEFSDVQKYLGIAEVGNPIELPESMYPPSSHVPMTLVEAVTYGSARNVSSLSVLYPDGVPIISVKSKNADNTAENRNLIELAIETGDICTLLYVVVWDLESKGTFDIDVKSKLDAYLANAQRISYEGMLESIKGPEDKSDVCTGAEQHLRDLAKKAFVPPLETSKADAVQGRLHHILHNIPDSRIIVANSTVETIEIHFTNPATPDHLIDPVTGLLYHCPVVMPSGQTVSLHVAESKPRIDIFTNKPFDADQRVVPNRHLQDLVDNYIGQQAHKIITDSSGSKESFTQALYIMSLMRDRTDLNCCAMERREFSRKFWKEINTLLPFVPLLEQNERNALFLVLSRGGFQRDVYISMLLAEANVDRKKALCMLFPTPHDAYDVIAIRSMFQASEEIKTNALRVIHVFLEIKKENMLVILQEESTEAFWEALRCAASIFERTKFNELLKDLPFGSDVMTLLSSNELSVSQSVMLGEQSHKSTTLNKQLEDMKAQLQAQQQEKQIILDLKQELVEQKLQLEQDLQTQQQKYDLLYEQHMELQKLHEETKKENEQNNYLTKLVQQKTCGNVFSTYYCGGKCDVGPVWGSNPYTLPSHKCSAAKHAGVIPSTGGFFTVKMVTVPDKTWTGSISNGITSHAAYGGRDTRSFNIHEYSP